MTEDRALLSDAGLSSTRRQVLLASLLSALPLGLSAAGATAPAVIGIFGLAPVDLKLVDPSKPAWRNA